MTESNKESCLRIKDNNVAFKEDKENVGNGKLTGSVREEIIGVSGTIMISVQNVRHRPSPELSTPQAVRNPLRAKSPRRRSPSWRISRLPCKDHF